MINLQDSTLDLLGFVLTDIRPKHDETEGGLLTVTVMSPIRSNAEAAAWDQSFVGAERCFNGRDALGDDDKTPNDHILKLKFRDDQRRVTVAVVGTVAPLIEGKNAEFKFAELVTKARAAHVKIQFTVRGVDGTLVGKVFDQIGKSVSVRAETAQQGLPFDGKVVNFKVAQRAITPVPGAFVVGILASDGSEFGGIVSEVMRDGDTEICKVVDLDDRVYPVTVAEIRSQHSIAGPKGKSVDTVIKGLKEQAKASGFTLSFNDLLKVLLDQFAGMSPSETKVLTMSVQQLTLKSAKDRAAASPESAESAPAESEAVNG